ncbi:glutamate racemase [Vibrio hannami]|uniref:glutamate racemase n=1 Tax=Vibrio hannami TaxID=2717094 RepID=UPI00241018DF|nr:glutamate racemase [Vibrio hannami]MDG3086647.1 glutamate racemase [Vibrio hannami]
MSLATQKPFRVLVFDSGVGGLSVYKEIRKLLPDIEYIYLFDNEAYPYGELEKETLIHRVKMLVEEVVKRELIDIVVIACNTASTIVLPKLREVLDVPVVGVVPAIKPASLIAHKAVGLIATPATVKREYTYQLIESFASSKEVKLLGSTRLVNMAEEKLCGIQIDLEELEEILSPLKHKVDVAVLGCTHFPLLKEEIDKVFGGEVILIDSGEAIARRVKSLLPGTVNGYKKGRYKIYSSAALGDKTALDSAVGKLNFSPIETLPIQDV